MAKLFLDGIFNNSSDSPSTITISVPVASGTSFVSSGVVLRGLIIGDPTWTAANKWGPILNDFSNLQDWASLLGMNNQFSWINASTMCWKGTSPLSINVEFYLINYAKGLNLKGKLNTFVKLAAVAQSENNSDFRVQVHGGYAPDIFSGNKSYYDTNLGIRDVIANNKTASDLNKDVTEGIFGGGKIATGSLSIKFGHKSTIRNLLLSRVSVTESTIEVADENGGNIQPLYYRVAAQFTGVQPLVTSEVENIFSGANGSVPSDLPGVSAGDGSSYQPEVSAPALIPITEEK